MNTPNRTLFPRISASLLIGIAIVLAVAFSNAQIPSEFNQPGNILITDQFNNRVIEIDPAGNIVWHFGNGPQDISPSSIVGTNDAERVGDLTLMSGTGIPPGATSNCPSGCVDNRVLLVDQGGEIVWCYGQFGVTGSGPNELNTPVQNTYLHQSNGDDHILITDQGNGRIIEVRRSDKQIVWQYDGLNNPNAAELLTNGNILISDENNNRAIEVTHTMPSTIVKTFTAHGTVSGVAFASRLPNGHTLITDSNNSRIVEVDRNDNPVPGHQYITNTRPGSNPSPLPTRAVRLANGYTLISDQFNDQVIEINQAKQIVRSFGTIDVPGFSTTNASVMNAPYSAYVIGDYTGITPPF